ncbi:MAG: DUF4296 domain-containing protein [Bacteroidota bacterium]
MKKLLFPFLVLFLVMASCKESPVKAPKNLIDENQMVDIIYDLSLLDAMKSQGYGAQQNYPSAAEFLKKKYKIDSLTFAENSKYYAADIPNYKKMYDKVKERLSEESTIINGGKPLEVNEEEGIVK